MGTPLEGVGVAHLMALGAWAYGVDRAAMIAMQAHLGYSERTVAPVRDVTTDFRKALLVAAQVAFGVATCSRVEIWLGLCFGNFMSVPLGAYMDTGGMLSSLVPVFLNIIREDKNTPLGANSCRPVAVLPHRDVPVPRFLHCSAHACTHTHMRW